MFGVSRKYIVISLIIHLLLFILLFGWKIIYYRNSYFSDRSGARESRQYLYFTMEKEKEDIPEANEGGAERASKKRTRPRPAIVSRKKDVPGLSPSSKKILEELKTALKQPLSGKKNAPRNNRESTRASRPDAGISTLPPPAPPSPAPERDEIVVARDLDLKGIDPVKTRKPSVRKRPPPPPEPEILSQPQKQTPAVEPVPKPVREQKLPAKVPIDDADMRIVDKDSEDGEELLRPKRIEDFIREEKTATLGRNVYSREDFKNLADAVTPEDLSAARFYGITLSNYGWDWKPWLLNLRRRVKAHWFPPSAFIDYGLGFGKTIVVFKIDRKGNMLEYEVIELEGRGDPLTVRELHQASKNAILSAAPFPPLPDDYPDDILVIRFGFHYLDSSERYRY